MLPIENLLRLNQYAQELKPLREAKLWFDSMSVAKKRQVLRELASLFKQAGALPEDLSAAVQWAGLKPSYTPCVLMGRGRISIQAAKVAVLPEQESTKAFLLFLGLLSVADARRREMVCLNRCSHWWHQNLSDRTVVQEILEM